MSSIRTLRTFVAVARHGSFAAAGAEIGLTAAAVGLQMRALEQDLNRALFDRGARSVVLNTAGREALPRIEELLLRYDELRAAGDDGGLSGVLVMGALVSALMGRFADALWSLRQENPRLEVRLFGGLSSRFAEQVADGSIDAAVVTRPPRPLGGGLVWTALYSEPMVMIVPRRPHFALASDPLGVLSSAPFIRFERHTWTGHLVDDVLERCRVRVNDSVELNSVEAIVELVRQGFGVSIVPQLANIQWDRDRQLRVIPLPGIDVQRRVGLLERRQHARTRFTEAIKRFFEQG